MATIRVDVPGIICNGQAVTFKSPANCSQVTGLRVYYKDEFKEFQFADAHGNNVGSIDLFAANVLVKVILDTDLNRAYVQNADTNAYLEARLASKASTNLYTATIPTSGWSGSAPYTLEVTINGILSTDVPNIDIDLSSANTDTAKKIIEEWTKVGRITTAANKITVYCYEEKPSVALPIQLKVVR